MSTTDPSAPRLRVLYLTYYFPPLGGAGVQRAAKFAKYLPEFGIEPLVITGPGRNGTCWSPLDGSLAAELGSGNRVYRPDGRGIAGEREVVGRGRRLRGLLMRGSLFARAWVDACVELGTRAAREVGVDAILAGMSPFETSVAATRLSDALGVPWLADLRDPWALDEMMVYATRWHRKREIARMRAMLASASRVIMNAPEAARALVSELGFEESRVSVITNGYDREDFRGPAPVRDDDRFRIVHTGHLHAELGRDQANRRRLRRLLGGERVPVDFLSRSHVHLMRALVAWRDAEPSIAGRVEVVLAGNLSAVDRAEIARSAAADMVRVAGYLPHSESVRLLRGADLLFLPMHGLPPGERARIVPAKTYEYLAAGRPILAAVPEGDARDLLAASRRAELCDPDDVDAMVRILGARYRRFRAGETSPAATEAFCAAFERRALTRRLADELGRAVGQGASRAITLREEVRPRAADRRDALATG